jgi:hypothetical protein
MASRPTASRTANRSPRAAGSEPEPWWACSRQALETLQPLADRLGVAVDTRFLKGAYADLVGAIRSIDGVVLVSWEHRLIPAIAALIVGDAARVPDIWPDDRYDLVWVFERAATGDRLEFRQAAQMLLAGDLPDDIR